MTQLFVDSGLSSKLNELKAAVELCDPSGKVLGRFIPLIDASKWQAISPDVTENELNLREQSNEWFTTEGVLSHLSDLEKP